MAQAYESFLSTFSLTSLDAQMIPVGIVLFVIFWKVTERLVFGPSLKLIEDRELAIDGARFQASTIREQALNARNSYEEALQSARVAANVERVSIVQEARSDVNKIIDSAESQARSFISTVRGEIDNQARQAKDEIAAQIDSLSDTIANKVQGRLGVTLLILLPVLCTLFGASNAFASEEHEVPHFVLSQFVYYWINFLLFTGILYKLLAKPLKNGLIGRREGISANVAEAAADKRAAEKELSEAKTLLAAANTTAAAVAESIKKQGIVEAEGLRLAANEKAVRINGQAQELAQAEGRSAERAIRDELLSRAFDRATEKLKERVTGDVDTAFRKNALSVAENLIH